MITKARRLFLDGKRRKRKEANAAADAAVDVIYAAYPKKVAPLKAKKSIRAALAHHSKAVILAGIARMVTAMKEQGIVPGIPLWSKVKYPQGYFSDQMYLNDPKDFPWYAVNQTRLMGHVGKYDKFKKAHDGL